MLLNGGNTAGIAVALTISPTSVRHDVGAIMASSVYTAGGRQYSSQCALTSWKILNAEFVGNSVRPTPGP
jgi:hypothetical protein